jgi:uncharacterized protein (DUF4415 family)
MKKEYDFTKGKRGPVVPPVTNKTRITIRLDNDIINWFKNKVHESGGGNYQSMINEALHKHIEAEKESIEQVLRRVVREELHRDSASPR